ncbi:MAG: hypothetical protein KF678_03470 [Phycisphaeraceae bacterium]|nr:hypothetical protein [Phycisphaeraceae bacterium]
MVQINSVKDKYECVQRIAALLFNGSYDVEDLAKLEALISERLSAQAAVFFANKNKKTGTALAAAHARVDANSAAIENWLETAGGKSNEL